MAIKGTVVFIAYGGEHKTNLYRKSFKRTFNSEQHLDNFIAYMEKKGLTYDEWYPQEETKNAL